jgi:NAD(P)-dependent dehydrogenase (short-subunit alcohol dehydrogenase family)
MVEKEVVLVTAGARRVGSHLCKALTQGGYHVVLHYCQSRDAALNLQKELSCAIVQADLRDRSALKQMFGEATGAYGRIDHLINNASVFPSLTMEQTTIEAYDSLMDLHATAPFFLSQYLYLHLKERSAQGSVINILDSKLSSPTKSRPAYYCAKGALLMQTKALSSALAPILRVNAISPGAILSNGDDAYFVAMNERLPLKRTGSEKDLYRAVDYLLHASFVTGEELVVDGGQRLL